MFFKVRQSSGQKKNLNPTVLNRCEGPVLGLIFSWNKTAAALGRRALGPRLQSDLGKCPWCLSHWHDHDHDHNHGDNNEHNDETAMHSNEHHRSLSLSVDQELTWKYHTGLTYGVNLWFRSIYSNGSTKEQRGSIGMSRQLAAVQRTVALSITGAIFYWSC